MNSKVITVFGCEMDERQVFDKRAARSGIEIRCVEEVLYAGNTRHIAHGSAVSVNHKAPIDASLIRQISGRGVAYLSSRSAGLDHIDLSAARAAGIWVESMPYSPESVAEYTLMLMLMAARRADSILRRMQKGDFRLGEKRAAELRDMTVGIIGTGRIGRAVMRLLSGFGCRILAYDPRPCEKAQYVGLDELLKLSDIVSLHLPLSLEARHLLSRSRIAQMRSGAILVNTARGALVDAEALADALENGHIACAALDVVEGEDGWFYRDCSMRPAPPFARLLAQKNAIITPHTAFYTEHALSDVVESTILSYLDFIGGGKRWVG